MAQRSVRKMREIRFRAKRIDNKEWVEGDLVQLQSRTCIHCWNNGQREAHEVDENTVCEYIGLTDRKGKQIYENDIVQHYREHDNTYENSYSLVSYGDYQGNEYERVYGWSFSSGDIELAEKYEVVGNIFDNRELIEQPKHIRSGYIVNGTLDTE